MILYVPLDERPCNFAWPERFVRLARGRGRGSGRGLIRTVPRGLMGCKKQPADVEAIFGWLEGHAPEASVLVASVEALLYGGLLPSRIHYLSRDTLNRRFSRLRRLKQDHPHLRLYLHTIIMRSPTYNSSDEEPGYCAEWGVALHRLGAWQQQGAGRGASPAEGIPAPVIEDYVRRRRVNLSCTERVVDMAAEGCVSCIVVPQDDSAEFSFSSFERDIIMKRAADKKVRVFNHPGADELGCSLCARAQVDSEAGGQRRVFFLGSHSEGFNVVPRYEDRPLGEGIRQHCDLTGLEEVRSPGECDAVIAFNLPVDESREAVEQLGGGGGGEEEELPAAAPESVRELVAAIAALPAELPLYLADLRFTNGGDGSLLRLLDAAGLITRLSFYAGWNTCGNSIGTVAAAAALGLRDKELVRQRIVEDLGYMTYVRGEIRETDLPPIEDRSSSAEARRRRLGRHIISQIQKQFRTNLPNSPWLHHLPYRIKFPWSRRFEIELEDDEGAAGS